MGKGEVVVVVRRVASNGAAAGPSAAAAPAGAVPVVGLPVVGVASVEVAPPRLRRRPVLVAASVAAVCLGALVGSWAFVRVSDAAPVLAMRSTVARGEVIERGDVVIARVGADPALHPVPAAEAASVVGQRAAVDLPAGTLLTAGAVTRALVPPLGSSVVGLGLTPGLLPGGVLSPGDRVRVVTVTGPDDPATGQSPGQGPGEVAAVVAAVHPSPTSTTVVVDVVVARELAAQVAVRAAAGQVVLVLDSRER